MHWGSLGTCENRLRPQAQIPAVGEPVQNTLAYLPSISGLMGAKREISLRNRAPTDKGRSREAQGSRSCLIVLIESRRMPPGRACE